MLIPLENRAHYNPIHAENQFFIVDPFKMGMFGNFPQPYQLLYTFEGQSFHSNLWLYNYALFLIFKLLINTAKFNHSNR